MFVPWKAQVVVLRAWPALRHVIVIVHVNPGEAPCIFDGHVKLAPLAAALPATTSVAFFSSAVAMNSLSAHIMGFTMPKYWSHGTPLVDWSVL